VLQKLIFIFSKLQIITTISRRNLPKKKKKTEKSEKKCSATSRTHKENIWKIIVINTFGDQGASKHWATRSQALGGKSEEKR